MRNISAKFYICHKFHPANFKLSSGNEIVDGQTDRGQDYHEPQVDFEGDLPCGRRTLSIYSRLTLYSRGYLEKNSKNETFAPNCLNQNANGTI
jgi:hypothetical protein